MASAINRYRRNLPVLDPTMYQSHPVETIPDISGLAAIASQYQGMYDITNNIPKPKYFPGRETDVQKHYIDPIYSKKQEAIDALMSGNTGQGIRSLKEINQFIYNAKQPGGVFNQFEKEAEEGYKKIEQYQKDDFKENPLLAKYAAEKIGLNPFITESGQYGGLNYGTFVRDVPQKEMNEFFNQTLDNIKSTFIEEGYDRKMLDGITTLHDFKKISGTTFDRALSILERTMPEEYKGSLRQMYNAERHYNPNLPDRDPTQLWEYEYDKQGNPIGYKKNAQGQRILANTPLAAQLTGFAQAAEHYDVSHDRVKDNNEMALELFKKSLDERSNPYNEQTQNYKDPTVEAAKRDFGATVDSKGRLRMGNQSIADREKLFSALQSVPRAPGTVSGSLAVGLAKSTLNFFDSLFGKDVVSVGDPKIKHISDNAKYIYESAGKGKWKDLSEKQKADLVKETVNSAFDMKATGFTAEMNPKVIAKYDDVFARDGVDSKGNLQNTGLVANRMFIHPELGLVDGTRLVQKMGDGAKLTFKGAVNDPLTSTLPFGTSIWQVGDKEIYMLPSKDIAGTKESIANNITRSQYAGAYNTFGYRTKFDVPSQNELKLPRGSYTSTYDMKNGRFIIERSATKEKWSGTINDGILNIDPIED